MRDKAYQLKPLLTDRNALSQCETEIRECQKYIDYFTEELAKITSRGDVEDTVIPSDTAIANRVRASSVGATEGHGKKYSTLGKFMLSFFKKIDCL